MPYGPIKGGLVRPPEAGILLTKWVFDEVGTPLFSISPFSFQDILRSGFNLVYRDALKDNCFPAILCSKFFRIFIFIKSKCLLAHRS